MLSKFYRIWKILWFFIRIFFKLLRYLFWKCI